MHIPELTLNVIEWEARYLLGAIKRESDRLKILADTTDDEDVAADAGNDYMEIIGLYERIRDSAVEKFGLQITSYD